MPHIPYDVYQSPQEMVVIMPLGGVDKKSITINLKDYRLHITGERIQHNFKEDIIPLKQECYWGPIQVVIDLPSQVYFDKIHSKLTTENILEIIIPKTLMPEKIALEIEKEAGRKK